MSPLLFLICINFNHILSRVFQINRCRCPCLYMQDCSHRELLRACLREFLPLVMSHHENMDGSGSPEGLAGEQIPLGARIVHVVESYVSLVSSRGYHHALGRRRAIGELRHQGRLYDQQVVEALASVLAGGIRTAT